MSSTPRWHDDEDSSQADSPIDRRSDRYERFSWDSARSYSTAHTAVSTRPTLDKHDTCFGRIESHRSSDSLDFDDRKTSFQTYASTEASDVEDEDEDDDEPYELLEYPEEEYQSDAIPATPQDFAELFPSSRRLSISHDDSTVDGNMNLRVDTLVETEWSSKKQNLTLFHLKMNDLKGREFSLRRYCRDSGREVCKTIRKYQTPPKKQRPTLTKSFSSAFSGMRKHHEDSGPQMRHLKRNDSGYGSVFTHGIDDDEFEECEEPKSTRSLPSNTIKFEFSNYANVELKRRGAGSTKSYQFEYWGREYMWRRKVHHDGDFEEVSFHLLRRDKTEPLAHIVPVPLTKKQVGQERSKGGWIAPCSMWITDSEVLSSSPDHADLVVATGLIALVDDAIKRRWHSTTHRQVLLPLIRNNSFRLNMEYIGPKRLIDEVFNRRPTSRGKSTQQSPTSNRA